MDSSPIAASRPGGQVPTCGYCGQAIPVEPVRRPDADPVAFCSETCARSYTEGDEPFERGKPSRRRTTGVGALDALLRWGFPANSIVLLAGEEGMRHRGLQTELAWRSLRRGEPAVFVSFVDPPVAIADEFAAFGWNVLPFLESGDLHVVDCFTNRLREEHRTPEHQVDWNAHVEAFLDDAVTRVREPDNLREVETKLHDALDRVDAIDAGVVLVDSINEAVTQGRQFRTEQFVAEVRADVCKRRYVPIFVSTTITDEATFARNHGYLFDGIVDMRHNHDVVPKARIKQISVRKMDGVPYLPYWAAYENVGYRGFEVFDPDTQLDAVYAPPDDVPADGTGGHRLRGTTRRA